MRLLLLFRFLLLILCTAAGAAPVELAEGALRCTVPDAWRSVTPRSRILERELAVDPPEGTTTAAARLTIMRAGGSADANIARWVGQFEGASEAQTEQFEVDGMAVTQVELEGTYLESAGGPFGPKTPRAGYRLIGAIVETGDLGNYFFKLIGPDGTVAPAASDFQEALRSLDKR